MLTDTDIGRHRQWQVQQLRGPFAVFAELLLAVYTTEARPRSLTAVRYHERPWRRLIETTGAVLARGRDRGESVEQVVATIWAAIEQAEVDTARRRVLESAVSHPARQQGVRTRFYGPVRGLTTG